MRDGALFESKFLPDGREVVIYPLTYGRARLTVSTDVTGGFLDDGW